MMCGPRICVASDEDDVSRQLTQRRRSVVIHQPVQDISCVDIYTNAPGLDDMVRKVFGLEDLVMLEIYGGYTLFSLRMSLEEAERKLTEYVTQPVTQ
jgi:hypothetical protein